MGYFLVMIVFCIIAIAVAKNGHPWIWYGIGAVLQLLAIMGAQRKYSYWGMGGATTSLWMIYIVILVVAAAIISFRRKNKE